MSIVFAPLTGYTIYGSVSVCMSAQTRSSQTPNWARPRLKLKVKIPFQPYARVRMSLGSRGNFDLNFARTSGVLSSKGFSGVTPPLPNYGAAVLNLRAPSVGHVNPTGTGRANLRMKVRSNFAINYGRAPMAIGGFASEAPDLSDGLILILQSSGIMQMSSGYEASNLHADGTAVAAPSTAVGVQVLANALAGSGIMARANYIKFLNARATVYADVRQLWFGDLNVTALAEVSTTRQFTALAALYADAHAAATPRSVSEMSAAITTTLLALAMVDGIAAAPLSADAIADVDVSRLYNAMGRAIAAATAHVSATPVLAFMAAVSADAIAQAQGLTTAAQFVALAANANAYVRAQFGTAGDDFEGWVLNAQPRGEEKLRGFSSYDNFPYTSFTTFPRGGKGYATGADGIYLLEGDTDTGTKIPAYVRSGLIDFGSRRDKRMESMYIGYTSDNKLVAKIITTISGKKVETWYTMRETPTAEAPIESRIEIGKGLHSVYWGFELHNVDGADMAIDIVSLWPVFLDRRIG